MSQFFYVHPDNPQARLITQAVAIIRNGGVVVYPDVHKKTGSLLILVIESLDSIIRRSWFT